MTTKYCGKDSDRVSANGRRLALSGGGHRPVVTCRYWLVNVTAYDGVNDRKMSLFTPTVAASTVQRIIRRY